MTSDAVFSQTASDACSCLNSTPKSAVSLRFAIAVGSYEEADFQRGFAHFVEHMAFRSTRGFPNGATDKVFAPRGVAFGRDQNAATTTLATTYQLDLPRLIRRNCKPAWDGFATLPTASFSDEAVNLERDVLIAEMEARGAPLQVAQAASRAAR